MKLYFFCSRFMILLAAFMLALMAGCGGSGRPDLGAVSGTVTLDSKPLPGAMIIFRPESGKQSSGRTDENGQYKLHYIRDIQGAVVGHHQVIIRTANEDSPGERLPPRYNRQTTLTADVSEGANTIDFPLKSN